LSGAGFAGMSFVTRASSEEDFQKWIADAKATPKTIEYKELAKPSMNNAVEIYQPVDGLFDQIVMKYM